MLALQYNVFVHDVDKLLMADWGVGQGGSSSLLMSLQLSTADDQWGVG